MSTTATPTSTNKLRNHERSQDVEIQRLTVETVRVVGVGPSKASRLVRKYVATGARMGVHYLDWLLPQLAITVERRAQLEASEDYRRALTYSDPTGETAANRTAQHDWNGQRARDIEWCRLNPGQARDDALHAKRLAALTAPE